MDQTTLIVAGLVGTVISFAALYFIIYNAVRNALKDTKKD